MTSTRCRRKTGLERLAACFLSSFVLLSGIPQPSLAAMAEEISTAVPEQVENAEPASDELRFQTISTSPGDAETVRVDGMMPDNAEVSVQNSDVTSDGSLFAYDITITDSSGEEFQPEDDAPLRVEITNAAIGTSAQHKLRLWHIDDSGIREEIKDFEIVDDSIIFEAKGFSVYEVDNGVPPLRTYYYEIPDDPMHNTAYKPYYFPTASPDGSGGYKMICQQTIKDGEKLIFPQLPADISTRYTFVGWFPYDGEHLSDTPLDFNAIPAVTQNEDVTLRAVFKSCVYVLFHEQYNEDSHTFPVMATRRGDLVSTETPVYDICGDEVNEYAEVEIHDLDVAYDSNTHVAGEPQGMAFKGWTIVPDTCTTAEAIKAYTESADAQIITTEKIRISKTTRLYPVFEPIRWLEFYTNQDSPAENASHYSGATYKPPLYFPAAEGFSFEGESPPACAGYSFNGWYLWEDGTPIPVTDAALHLNTALSTDTLEVQDGKLYFKPEAASVQEELYAQWTPSMSQYTIVIWKQRETDDANLPADQKSWYFERSIRKTAKTDTSVSVDWKYQHLNGTTLSEDDIVTDFTGFSYDNERNAMEPEEKIVRGDGTTTLNVYYQRNEHTFTFQSGAAGNPVIHTVTALYGSDISNIWHFTGSDGITYPRTDTVTSWMPTNSQVYTARITQMLLMPDENLTFTHYTPVDFTQRKFHYYVEALPGTASTRSFGGKYFIGYNDSLETLVHDFQKVVYNDDFFEMKGFTRLAIATSTGTDVTTTIRDAGKNGVRWSDHSNWRSELYFYYTRNSYSAEFIDSFTNDPLCDARTILYQEPTGSYVPADPTPPVGYDFTGWYADESCSVPIAFTAEDVQRFQNSEINYQDYTTMPAHPIRVYAGWQTQWFKIEIDPNGGVLTGSQATWFWEPYNGDPIVEYKTVTKNYKPDSNGNYYYALRNRAYYGLGNGWDPREDTEFQNQVVNGRCTRGAFYTTETNEATSEDRYSEMNGIYRYLGWYEVDPVTGDEIPFNFNTRVLKDTYLRLRWKQLDTYYIKYMAGEGRIAAQDTNETTFEFLDADDYADHAEVVVTRVAVAPEGKVFTGWKIRNDPSDTIYYPGQYLQFSSSFATTYFEVDEHGETVTKRVIILDAIYEEIRNAKIIYDANGGSVDDRALTHGGGQDPDRAPEILTDGTAHPLTVNYAIQDDQLIVSDLMNNSAVRLADGTGFTNPGYIFVGWCTAPRCTDGKMIRADSIRCYVDTDEPLVLYAQWQVRVFFDKNNANAPNTTVGWGGDWTESGYLWSASQQKYFLDIIIGQTLAYPAYAPHSDNEEEMFRYWSLKKQTTVGAMETPFDFQTPITQELLNQYSGIYSDGQTTRRQLTLYGCWDEPIRIPVHIVDTTDSPWNLHDDWLRDGITHITLNNDTVSLRTAADALQYAAADKVSSHSFAFAGTAGNGDTDYLNVSDDRQIQALRYDAGERQVLAQYPDGSWHALDTSDTTPDAVYLVYYASSKPVPISYQKYSLEGNLTAVSPLNSNAPRTANITRAEYYMNGAVTRPDYWAASSSFEPEYYSFAIGDVNAANASGLHIITRYSNSDSDRPRLMLRNTWNGFEYSLDGENWQNCGYEIELYVLYYEARPTVVSLTEQTVALPEFMDEAFNYNVTLYSRSDVTVTKTYYYKLGTSYLAVPNNNNYSNYKPEVTTTPGAETDVSTQEVTLSDGQLESFALFYCEIPQITQDYTATTQTIRVNGMRYTVYYQIVTTTRITQRIGIEQTPMDEYVTRNDAANGDQECQASHTATSDGSPVTITYTNQRLLKREIHVAVAGDGIIREADPLRTDDAELYRHTFGDTWELSELDPGAVINDTTGRYGFAGICAGTADASDIITPLENIPAIESLAFGAVGDDTYGFCLNGNPALALDPQQELYFVYFERPTIRYMFQSPRTGELLPIDPLQKNGTLFKRNGTPIAQNETLPLDAADPLFLAQISTPGHPAFLIPDLLDHNGKHSVLDMAQIGVKDETGTIVRHDAESVYLHFADNQLHYSFAPDGETCDFSDEHTVYAIYRIRGYTLTLSKKVAGNAGMHDPTAYRFTISSEQLADGEYYVGGYGDAETITAENGTFTLTVHNKDSVTIYGLAQGIYSVTEETTGGFQMLASVNGIDVTTNGQNVLVSLQDDTTVDILNLYPVPVTGRNDDNAAYLIPTLLLAAAVLLLLRKRKGDVR